ncbi:hypothetical protein HF568_15285 [Acidithiobacillus ferridurans]|uniref:Uncharacterized protein n=1 Tax=Acidithiobacillus ferridurans TaxID=1232575 RepID=A0A8X8GEC0_ACIFI|nr:hypothetical protein [Acidithiobacillus ferridurans]
MANSEKLLPLYANKYLVTGFFRFHHYDLIIKAYLNATDIGIHPPTTIRKIDHEYAGTPQIGMAMDLIEPSPEVR